MNQNKADPLIQILCQDQSLEKVCQKEISTVRSVIGASRSFVDHVGSTAVPKLHGKPVIDLMLSVEDWNCAAGLVSGLESHGYLLETEKTSQQRHFMRKPLDAGTIKAVHLHIVPTASDFGNNMKVFRDELRGDDKLASAYVALKRKLATDHPGNIDSYTSGKADFVNSVLNNVASRFSNDGLLTHQRAELDRAQLYQNLATLSQLLLAASAAMSVYQNDNAALLGFAVVGFVLAGAWFVLAQRQRLHRNAGNQARRAVLLASGLGHKFSPEQRLRIFDQFIVSIEGKPLVREDEYFASRAEPSHRRLAELIEESAYWTLDLQKASATALQWSLSLLVALLVVWLAAWAPAISSNAGVSMSRALIAFLVFLVSADVVGAMLAHREAAQAIGEIFQRVETVAAREYSSVDVQLIMTDYNAAVEGAHSALPGIYALRNKPLTRRWRSYLQNKREGLP